MTVDEFLDELVMVPAGASEVREVAVARLRGAITSELEPDRTLARAVSDALPSAHQKAVALDRLRRAARPGPVRRVSLVRVALSAAAVIVATIAAAVILRPVPAVGALGELAEATRLLTDIAPHGETIVFGHQSEVFDQLVVAGDPDVVIGFFRTTSLDVVASADGWTITTTVGPARFATPADEARARSAGVADAIAPSTRTETFSTPPIDPVIAGILDGSISAAEALDTVLIQAPESERPGLAASLVAEALSRGLTSPGTRADLLEALAGQPGITQKATVDGGVVVTVATATERRVMRFTADGWLAEQQIALIDGFPDLGVPPGTVIETTDFRPPRRG